ncbi:hypothetical protein BGX38DRAFT_1214251 [Terfezia claveryi]|nr:hypothetical protein BGX38DRAFT_1214251 [Terfezia claveryi]
MPPAPQQKTDSDESDHKPINKPVVSDRSYKDIVQTFKLLRRFAPKNEDCSAYSSWRYHVHSLLGLFREAHGIRLSMPDFAMVAESYREQLSAAPLSVSEDETQIKTQTTITAATQTPVPTRTQSSSPPESNGEGKGKEPQPPAPKIHPDRLVYIQAGFSHTQQREEEKRPAAGPSHTQQGKGSRVIIVHAAPTKFTIWEMRRWLEKDNNLAIVGARWLTKKRRLSGKTHSSLVIYLDSPTKVQSLRMGSKTLRTTSYERRRSSRY